MSLGKNKAIAARYFEDFWNKGNTAVVDELCAPNVHIYAPLAGDFNGREAVKSFINPILDAIEGYRFDMTRLSLPKTTPYSAAGTRKAL